MLSIRLLVNSRQGSAVYPYRYFQDFHGKPVKQQNSNLLFLVESFRYYLSEVSQKILKHKTGDGLRSGTALLLSCPGW